MVPILPACTKSMDLKIAACSKSPLSEIKFLLSSCLVLVKIGDTWLKHTLSEHLIDRIKKQSAVAHLMHTSALLICPLSGLAFYHQLCENELERSRKLRRSVVKIRICILIRRYAGV